MKKTKVYEKGKWQGVFICKKCNNKQQYLLQYCPECGNFDTYSTKFCYPTTRRWCYTTKRTVFNLFWELLTTKAKGYWEYYNQQGENNEQSL